MKFLFRHKHSTIGVMGFFQSLYYFFSRYADPAERRVGRFFSRISEADSEHAVQKSLRPLIQRDLAVVNLWTEHRYKGYQYLTKRRRRELYANLALIHEDFAKFSRSQTVDIKEELTRIASLGVDTAKLRLYPEQLCHLVLIQRYLSPRRGLYVYQESSSFGRLLRDPGKEKLVGDCNQIVTLYLSLYAAAFEVTDLKLTLYPGHVALHFEGVDIETTNGTFRLYDKPEQRRVAVYEIVSVNLLDTSDVNFTKSTVNPEVFLQAARLAYVVSGHRALVKRNLEVAYHNTVRHHMEQKQYKPALAYAKQSGSFELIQAAAHNGAAHAAAQHDFSQARVFAASATDKSELLRTIDRQEAAWLYNAQRYHEAIELYQRMGDRDMVRQGYRALYAKEQEALKGVRTTEDLKSRAGTVRTMERYAKASGDAQLIKHIQSLTKHL